MQVYDIAQSYTLLLPWKSVARLYTPLESTHICHHYENMPIQMLWKFYHQKMKIFRLKISIFFIFLLKTYIVATR